MFDGGTLSRSGHSAGCVTLSDGTVVLSVFGGRTRTFVVSNPCFYQWGKSMIIVIQRLVVYHLLCSDTRHPSMLLSGLAQAGAVPRADSHVSAATRSPTGGTNEEVRRDHW